jgi:hypothetical protein
MGAEREDTDPTASRVGTEPGLGKASVAQPAVAAPIVEDEAAAPVDFDALHAALGDPLDYQEMGSGPALEKGNEHENDDLLEPIEATTEEEATTGPGVRIGESSGRSSATYASARPHTIPPTRAPTEDPNAPAVIVASDTDTVPSAPPQMTVPLAASPHAAQFTAGGLLPGGAAAGPINVPGSNPRIGAAVGSGPHGAAPAHPSSGPHPASPSLGVAYPNTPQPIPVQPRGGPQMTIRMPDRPVNARRGKTPTIVVRPRGPSTKQKLLAFMAMLVLVTACGIAVIIWRKPHWLNLDGFGGTAPTTSAPPVAPSATLGAMPSASASGATSAPVSPGSATTAAAAAGSSSASPSSSASAKKGPKTPPPPAPPPHPLSSSPSNRL